MGKERFIEGAKKGLESTRGVVKTGPHTVLFGVGAVVGASGLGLATIKADTLGIVLTATSVVLNIGVGIISWRDKRERGFANNQ